MTYNMKRIESFHEQIPYNKYSTPFVLYVAVICCFVLFAIIAAGFIKILIEEGFNTPIFVLTLLPLAGVLLLYFNINNRKNMTYTVDVTDGELALMIGSQPFAITLKEVDYVDARHARGIAKDKVKHVAFHRGIREHFVYVVDIDSFLEVIKKWVEPNKILI